jgi:hypothetical protein
MIPSGMPASGAILERQNPNAFAPARKPRLSRLADTKKAAGHKQEGHDLAVAAFSAGDRLIATSGALTAPALVASRRDQGLFHFAIPRVGARRARAGCMAPPWFAAPGSRLCRAAGDYIMTTRMLIDARHSEETRVAVLKGNRIEEFDFDSADHKQIKGNIYLAKVTRVEPSLQAAFVDFGGNRHGFLAFSEIHPDYYQIPKEDREALLAEEAAHAEEEAALRASSEGTRISRMAMRIARKRARIRA